MPKSKLEDIKPITRRDGGTPIKIRAEERKGVPKGGHEPEQDMEDDVVMHDLPRRVPFHPKPQRTASHRTLWYVAVLCVVGFFLSLSFIFEHGTVTITPKSSPLVLDSGDTFTAFKDSTSASAVVFTEMTLTGDQSVTVPSTETKTLAEPAKGTVVLYNAYSKASYKLAKNTRLQAPNGQVYRLDSGVTIPGYTGSGSALKPGFIEAKATAAEAGEAGNLTNAGFTLPGLAGTPQHSKVYARSKTAFAGGVSGKMYTISQDSANAAFDTLKEKLQASLMAKARVQVPDGYLFYEGATLFTPGESVQAPYSKDPEVTLALTGSMTAYLIREDSLVQAITKKFVSQYAGEPVMIPGLAEFPLKQATAITPGKDTTFTFSFDGTSSIVWKVDTEMVLAKLTGTKKAGMDAILSEIVGVDRAQTVVKPFWKQSFPKDPKRMTVTVEKVQ